MKRIMLEISLIAVIVLLCSNVSQGLIRIDEFETWQIAAGIGDKPWVYNRGIIYPTHAGIIRYNPATDEYEKITNTYYEYVLADGDHVVYGSIIGPVISNKYGIIQPYTSKDEFRFPTDIEGDSFIYIKWKNNITKWSPSGSEVLGNGIYARMCGEKYVYSLEAKTYPEPDNQTTFSYWSSPDIWHGNGVCNTAWAKRCFPAPYNYQYYELYFNNELIKTTNNTISDISIYEDRIVWSERLSYAEYDVMYWSRTTGILTVTDAPGIQRHPSIWGDWIAYNNQDNTNGDAGVWAATQKITPTFILNDPGFLIAPQPIPEPSGLMALVGAIGAFVLLRRRA